MMEIFRKMGWMAAIVLMLTATASCDSEGEGGGVGPIILITNQWRNEADSDHRFDLDSPDDNRSEGAFIGEEERPVGDLVEFNDLVGFWTDGRIQFTVSRPDGDVRYTGTFDEVNQKRLEFTSSLGPLVIIRD